MQDLQEQAEYGHKCKVALEVLDDFIADKLEKIVQKLAYGAADDEEILTLVNFMRVITAFQTAVKTHIQEGEIAQEELNNYGE